MTTSVQELFRVFGRIGVQSFGGPAAQIALMHKELVEERDWLSEDQFLRALSFCMLLPGPEAMQLATYAGWRKRGVLGGLIAGGLFVIPGATVIMCLALAYGVYGNLEWVQTMFVGIQATVVIIVIAALRKVAKKALLGFYPICVAIAAFVALFVFQIPFPLIILAAALIGSLTFAQKAPDTKVERPSVSSAFSVILIGIALWSAPILIAISLDATFLVEIGLFFTKLAIVTFGGAYAVLAYMAQTVVSDFGWLTAPQMLDALGLAETTPGPLILVTQFVGMLAGLSQGGTMLALLAGAMTLWVTFIPCFIWIFTGAPYIDWLASQPRLQAALQGITAAVVGVIANLSLWFALHVFFSDLTYTTGPIKLLLPALGSAQPMALSLAILAAMLIFWAKRSILQTLFVTAFAALALSWFI